MWPCYHIHRFFRKLELWPLTLRPRTLTVKLIWIDTPIDTLENPRWLPSQVKAFTRFQTTWLLTLRPTCKFWHFTTGVYCVISASACLTRLDSILLGFGHFLLQLSIANVRGVFLYDFSCKQTQTQQRRLPGESAYGFLSNWETTVWVRFQKNHDLLSDTNYWPIGGMQSADITFLKSLRTPSWVSTTQSIFLPCNKQSRGVFCCPGCCHLFQQKLNHFHHLNWAHIANKSRVLLTLLKSPILLLAPGSYLIFIPLK